MDCFKNEILKLLTTEELIEEIESRLSLGDMLVIGNSGDCEENEKIMKTSLAHEILKDYEHYTSSISKDVLCDEESDAEEDTADEDEDACEDWLKRLLRSIY